MNEHIEYLLYVVLLVNRITRVYWYKIWFVQVHSWNSIRIRSKIIFEDKMFILKFAVIWGMITGVK